MSSSLLLGRCIFCQKVTNTCHHFPCHHLCCEKCIGRTLFTSHLSEFKNSDKIGIKCYCNNGELTFTLNEIITITNNNIKHASEVLCEKHKMPCLHYCIDCKKWLCEKCNDSHLDLFNTHHFVDEEPPNSDVCSNHPNCFLDRYCNDCKCQICHLCLIEGNKHFCHSSESYDDLKEKIIDNVSRMKNKSFEEFCDFIQEIENEYNEKYKEAINKTNEAYSDLTQMIEKYKSDFINEMEEKLKRKESIIKIIQNLYNQFFSEYSKIESSFDYPVLCQLQGLTNDLLSISFNYSFNEEKFNEIKRSLAGFKFSSEYNTSIQFTLRVYKPFSTLIKHTNQINSMCVLKDGRLASASEDKTIVIWNKDYRNPDVIIEQSTPIKVVTLLNNKQLIAGGFKEIYLFNSHWKSSSTIKEQNNIFCILQLSDDKLITGSYRQIRAYTPQFKLISIINDHTTWVKALVKIKDNMFASGGEDSKVFIYDYSLKSLSSFKTDHEVLAFAPKFNGDFFIGDSQGNTYLYKMGSNTTFRIYSSVHNQKINSIICLQGGNYASGSADECLVIRNGSFEPIQIITEHSSSILCLCQMNDGKIVCGTADNSLHIYE